MGGTLWVLVLFVVPFYVVFSVAFGTVDNVFRQPVPYYAPWWWSFSTFDDTLSKFYGEGGDLPAGARPDVRLRVRSHR